MLIGVRHVIRQGRLDHPFCLRSPGLATSKLETDQRGQVEQVGLSDRMAGENAKWLGVAGIEHGIPNFFHPFDWILRKAARHDLFANWMSLL